MEITTDVQGLAELEKALLDLGAQTGFKTLRSAARKAMKPVLSDAQANVNVDSGDTKESLAISAKKGKGHASAVVVSVGNTRKKARKSEGGHKLAGVNQKVIAQEYGTKNQAADPFLTPALIKNKDQVLNLFKAELVTAIDRAVKKAAKTGKK
ncbi:HK97-gp10 family putative phage morphogenesis protein [uncultured Amphritea sp.]|uniref:HK97-gp10 family putative phage morphogenesis protein n=1 Tax=uncultured Amphritea sp. TaxID=981605 RepID=UPI00262FF807|nr:HK97-gp10 family putative phage morphogenesis protein [uncultured Amphritea sp.]